MRISDVEPHVRSVKRASRSDVSRFCSAHSCGGASGVRGNGGESPGYLRTDDGGQVIEREFLRRLQRRIGPVHRKPVHREEGVDIAVNLRWCGARRVVDDFFRACGVTERPEQVARAKERESRAVAVGQLAGVNLGEHRVCLFATAKPRKSMRANDVRFQSRFDVAGRLRESIGQGQIRQPDGAVGCPDEQVRVGCQVGVETQRGPPHDDLDVVTLIGPGEFGGDQPAQPPQLRGWRASRRTSP